MNQGLRRRVYVQVSAGCHINDVMNAFCLMKSRTQVSAGCHINDVMNILDEGLDEGLVSAGCHINDVMNSQFHDMVAQ